MEDMKMQNSTALATTNSEMLPACAGDSPLGSALVIAEVAALPSAQAEAEIVAELDRLQRLSNEDPLAALDQILGVMQGIDIEILKAMAPALIERSQLSASDFAARGKAPEGRRGDSRELASMLRLQEGIAKIAAARVKVRDEYLRRHRVAA